MAGLLRSMGSLLVCACTGLGLGGSGCSSVPVNEPSAEMPPVGAAPSVPKGSLAREEVVQAVDAGLGAFLQHVQVEPVFEGDAFAGFQLASIEPPGAWIDYGIVVGDVITHVNARSVEQETDAFDIFEQLRTAPQIRVRLKRATEVREVVIPIVGAGQPAKIAPTGGAIEPAGAPAPTDSAPQPK